MSILKSLVAAYNTAKVIAKATIKYAVDALNSLKTAAVNKLEEIKVEAEVAPEVVEIVTEETTSEEATSEEATTEVKATTADVLKVVVTTATTIFLVHNFFFMIVVIMTGVATYKAVKKGLDKIATLA